MNCTTIGTRLIAGAGVLALVAGIATMAGAEDNSATVRNDSVAAVKVDITVVPQATDSTDTSYYMNISDTVAFAQLTSVTGFVTLVNGVVPASLASGGENIFSSPSVFPSPYTTDWPSDYSASFNAPVVPAGQKDKYSAEVLGAAGQVIAVSPVVTVTAP